MKKIILLSLLALIVSACAVERRAITARLHTDKIFYVAYMEWQESIFGISDYCSKIKRCNFMDNNGMVCMDEQEAERILNPQKYGEMATTDTAPAPEAAPAEAAPAEAAPAEEAPVEAPAEAPAE